MMPKMDAYEAAVQIRALEDKEKPETLTELLKRAVAAAMRSSYTEIMNAAMTIYMYDREIYIIYHRATVASHTNQNFTISLVDLFDSTVISI